MADLPHFFFCYSLAVRDLSNLVKPEDVVTSEHLVTLLAVVPKYSQKDWLACYETLTDFVVKLLIIVEFHILPMLKLLLCCTVVLINLF